MKGIIDYNHRESKNRNIFIKICEGLLKHQRK